MTSRRDANLTQNNNTTHIHTDFLKLNLERTQKEVLQAIKDINISAEISGITVESSDTITHEKLDTLNSNLVNKHLDSTTDSVTVNVITGFATEETLQAMKVKTDDLTFSDNDGVIELRVFDSQNNIGLNTINDTITNKHLDSTTDSVTVNVISGFALESGGNLAAIKSNTDKLTSDPVLTDAIQVSIKNDILVVDPINNSINEAPYDLIINGPTLWADSLPLGNPFFADPNGREGWYYDNLSNIANKSNIYWYGNPTSGNFQENDMTFSQLSGMYSVITCDYVENGSLTIPTMGIFSQPTGTNDFLPGFAHSRWVYQLSALNRSKLRKGETLLLYTGSTRPNVHINLPSYQLSLVSVNGDALSSEIIAYMTVNTQATTSKIGYLLQYCGYLNSAIGFNREYSFKNSRERLGEENLSSLTFEEGKLIIYSAPIVNAINNKHLEFGYDKVDASGSSVSISNFPDIQPVSGTVAFSNTSIEVSGTVAFSNTSIQVSSMPNLNANTDSVTIVPNGDALPVSGTFFQATQPISGSVSVSNFPATQPVSIASTVPVSGSVSVSNFPATQPISGSISNSFTLDTTTQSSNTKLDTIHADLDGLTFDASSNLNVNVNAGSITVDSVKIKASNGDNLTATGTSLNTNITNTINTNSRTEDGVGNDITSTDLLNSKRGLDTASSLFGYAGSARTALTCDIGGKLMVSSYTSDDLGNGITSSVTSTSARSLDTASSLYVSNGTTRVALTATGSSLNTNITNTVPISGSISNSFTLDTTTQSSNTKLDTIHADLDGLTFDGSSNLNVNVNAGSITVDSVKIKASNGDNLTATGTSLNTNITNTSVDTHCYGSIDGTTWHHLKTTATGNLITESKTHDGSNVPITSTLNGAKQSLDVNVSNTVPVSISATVGVSDTTSQGYLNTINQGVGYAYIEAIAVSNATIAGNGSATFATWTRGQYRRTVFNYIDGAISNTDSISILTKDSLGNGIIIATFFPYVVAGIRQFAGILELSPFNTISVRNNSSSSISAVTLKIFSA